MSEPVEYPDMAEWGEVILDGFSFPVPYGLQTFELGNFPPKVTFGDFSRESDDLLSTWVIADLSGGGQVFRLHEGVDQGRYWRGNLHLRDPYQFTLNRLVQEFDQGETANAWPLGDLAGTFYFAFNRNVFSWDETTEAFTDTTDNLGQQPANTGIDFGLTLGGTPVLWVPYGANGYGRYDGSTVTDVADPDVVAFAEWDDLLWCVTTDGKLMYWDEAAVDFVLEARIDKRHTPRNLTSFWNAYNEPTLFVATDKGAFAYDRLSRRFYPSGIRTQHPQAGHGFAVWQEEGGISGSGGEPNQGNLFYSAGMATRRYEVGSVNAPVGLNRDDGVPTEHRGYVVDLKGAPGELYALVRGAEAFGEVVGIDADSVGEDSPTYPTTTAYASLYYFTNSGWFEAWASASASATPTKLFVSAAGGAVRVWWGAGGTAYSIEVPADEHVPRQGLAAGVDRFQPTGSFRTGKFDAQMLGFEKIGRHFQVNVREASATETVTIRYQTDLSEDWHTLATVTGTGRQIIKCGDVGLPFEEIEFEVEFARDPADSTKSPLVDSFVFHFVKVPHQSGTWEATIPFYFGEEALWKGQHTGKEIKERLKALLGKRGFVEFTHGDRAYTVRLSTVRGRDATGDDERGERTVSIVQIPLDSGDNLIEGSVA